MGEQNAVVRIAGFDFNQLDIHDCYCNVIKGPAMDIENRATKVMLKDMPVFAAEEKIALYKIKSPYKEILEATCILDKDQFEAMDWIKEKYKIHLGFRTFSRKYAKALEMFRTAHLLYNQRIQNPE